MIEGINIVAVAGTTFFMMASATVWFSPLLFGKLWLRQLRITEAEIEASRQNVLWHLGLTGLAYASALSVMAMTITRADDVSVTALQISAAAAILTTALLGATALWEDRSRWYFAINAGFYAYFLMVGTLMLKYWPW